MYLSFYPTMKKSQRTRMETDYCPLGLKNPAVSCEELRLGSVHAPQRDWMRKWPGLALTLPTYVTLEGVFATCE